MPDLQSVLITGASKGIGRATTRRLARAGFQVFAGVRRPEDGETLEQEDDHITAVVLDVTDQASIESAGRRIASETNTLSGLVNNAGIVIAGPLEALPLDEIRDQFEVNVFGVIAVTNAMLPLLRAGPGRIVNVSSINGRIVTPFVAPYSASKFALEAISDGMRLELRPWRIPVSVIQPGAVATSIWSTSTDRVLGNAREFDSELQERYGRVIEAITSRGRAPKHAIEPDRVASVIHRALTARRPRTRYLVGNDARIGAVFAALLPDAIKDYVLAGRHRRSS